MTSINPTRAVERCERLAKLGPPPSPRRGHPWKLTRKLKLWLREYRAIMALDITQCAEMLRDLYSSEYLKQMAERPNPTFALKRTGPRGQWVTPIRSDDA